MTKSSLAFITTALLAAAVAVTPRCSAAEPATAFPASSFLTGSWGGARDSMKAAGVSINLNYATETAGNVSGGEKIGWEYADNIALDLRFDLDRIVGFGGTTFLVKMSQRDGLSVSNRFIAPSEGGNAFPVQELYGGQTFKLVNVQLTTQLLDRRLDLAYGRIVANDDFLRSDLYCQFLNNSFCGSPKPVFYQNPFTFTAYPLATWGLRARYDTKAGDWTFQGAVYDGDPQGMKGDPSAAGRADHGTWWGFGNNGVTVAGEVHYHVNRNSDKALPGVYKVGGYYLTGQFQDLRTGTNATTAGNSMLWLLADQMLTRAEPGSSRGLSAFGAVVLSLTDRTNPMKSYFNVGLIYEGLFCARPRDKTGLAVTTGWYGGNYNDGRAVDGLLSKSYEAVFELNHLFLVGAGIGLQPDVQYVLRPAATGAIDNALVVGAKVSIDF